MKRIVTLAGLLLMSMLIGLAHAPRAAAGMFDSNSEVTYKEYWMSHTQFTGGCIDGLRCV